MRREPLLVVLLALLAHGGSLAAGFVYDDHRFVTDNPALADVGVWQALTDPSTHTADRDRDVYRPLRTLGHAFDYRRWGLDPFGFHLHSLLVHVVAVVLAWVVLRRLLPDAGPLPPLLGATVLAVHPLGVEVVGWVSSRGDAYALVLALAALLAASQRSAWVVTLGGVAAAAATLGKESAATIPIVAWLAGRLIGPRRPAGWICLLLGVTAALALRQATLAGATPVQTPPHGGSLSSQTGWAFYGLTRTLGHVLVPMGLSVEYPQDEWARGAPIWLRPATWVGILASVSPLLLLRRSRAGAFLAAWALLAWLPSSSLLVTLRSLVNDRAAYPMLAPLGAMAGLASARAGRGGVLLLAFVATAGIAGSWKRTADFHDDASLWRAVVDVNPGSVSAHIGLAAARPAAAGQHLRDAVRVARPGSKPEAAALARLGDHLFRVERDGAAAVPVLTRALAALRRWSELERSSSDEPATAATLAEALADLGRWEQAQAVLEEAIRRDPRPAPLLIKLAVLHEAHARAAADAALRERCREASRAALAAARNADPDDALVGAVEAWMAGLTPGPEEGLSRP